MSIRHVRSTARRLARAGVVSALSAALAAVLLAAPVAAAPAVDDAPPARPAISDPIAWVAGLIHDLIDPIFGPAAETPGDADRVHGTIGSGFDPNGHSGEPPGGAGRPGKPGRV